MNPKLVPKFDLTRKYVYYNVNFVVIAASI